MTSSTGDPCSQEPQPPPWVVNGPFGSSQLRIKVIVIVLAFAGLLLLRGYDLQAAMTSSLAAVVAASEVTRRILVSR